MGSYKGKHYIVIFILICGMMIALIAKLQSEFYNNKDYKYLVDKIENHEEATLRQSEKELQNMLASTERFKEKLRNEEALTSKIEGLKIKAQMQILYRALLTYHRK